MSVSLHVHKPSYYTIVDQSLVFSLGSIFFIFYQIGKYADKLLIDINLARQDAGYERFGATGFSRVIVRGTRTASNMVSAILPKPVRDAIEKRFEPAVEKKVQGTQKKETHAHEN